MLVNSHIIRVRYADTDKMQFVYNGKYLEYFEVGRTEMLRDIGLPYVELEKLGYQLPLIEAGLKYKHAAKYDDLLEIKAILKDIKSAKIHIEYEITKMKSGELVAEGFTDHVFMKENTKRAVKPPQIYIEKLAPFFEGQ